MTPNLAGGTPALRSIQIHPINIHRERDVFGQGDRFNQLRQMTAQVGHLPRAHHDLVTVIGFGAGQRRGAGQLSGRSFGCSFCNHARPSISSDSANSISSSASSRKATPPKYSSCSLIPRNCMAWPYRNHPPPFQQGVELRPSEDRKMSGVSPAKMFGQVRPSAYARFTGSTSTESVMYSGSVSDSTSFAICWLNLLHIPPILIFDTCGTPA